MDTIWIVTTLEPVTWVHESPMGLSWSATQRPLFLVSDKADQKNSLVSGPPTDPATTPPTVNFLQQSGEKKLMLYKLIC